MPVRPLLEAALELDAIDLNVMPVVPATKRPAERWKRFQTERTTDRLRPWFAGRSNYWLGVVCGSISGVVVLDIDSLEALAFWREQLGESLEATVHSRTPKAASKGEGVGHYWFRLPKVGPVVPCRGDHDENDPDGIHWDIKAEGGYVVSPPSEGYEWVRSPWDTELVEMPKALEGKKKKPAKGQAPMKRGRQAELIDNPGLGGRNNWVTERLGHYARLHRKARDLYDAEAERVWTEAASIEGDHDYDRAEFEKTRESIWRAEQRKIEDMHVQCTENTGWLISGDENRIQTQCRGKDDDGDAVFYHDGWADFDIEAIGVVEDDDAQRVYDVVVRRHRDGAERRALLSSSDLSDTRRLNAWLGGLGVGILEPQAMWPKTGSRADRLMRYIEAQQPPSFKVVSALGWDDESGGFVCHEGVITADGLQEHQGIKPHPRLKDWARYEYGFSSEQRALEVLRQVLTFHDETVTAVFGAWWAACLLKPQIDRRTAMFPILVVEAPSESGKTRGFFNLMLQLAGSREGHVEMTIAALRDAMSAHRSGIVWNDDLTNTQAVMELVRQATAGGTRVKKGEDRTEQVRAQIGAPFVLSGETVPDMGEKALRDRMVKLKAPSPVKRMSSTDPTRLQWDDILELQDQEGHLSRHAGTLVELMLRRADKVAKLASYRIPGSSGRWADKMAILRLGATILADVVGDVTIVQRVDEWCSGQVDFGSENRLTMELLPDAIRHIGRQQMPQPGLNGWPPTPVLVQRERVWFNPANLADWSRRHYGQSQRLDTKEGIVDQARQVGAGGSREVDRKRMWTIDRSMRPMYWRLPEDVSALVLERAEGGVGADTIGWTQVVHQGGQSRVDRPQLPIELATTRTPIDLASGYTPPGEEP